MKLSFFVKLISLKRTLFPEKMSVSIKHKVILSLLLVVIGLSNIYSQEVLKGLSVNPELLKKDTNQKSSQLKSQSLKNKQLSAGTLTIPFFDDFSYYSAYPDSTLWTDHTVLVNSKYSINPPTKGVVTFDALNKNRVLYDTTPSKSFYADTLTSRPINLKYPATSNIFLSFLYQPQGGGFAPLTGDSLMLEYYNPDSVHVKRALPQKDTAYAKGWKKVWAIPGSGVQPFKEVFLLIDDTAFLKTGFRFRFRNKASTTKADSGKYSLASLWNIDNIKLDKNRNVNDTFSRPLTTIPFLDDFASTAPYPDPKHWVDRYAYINSTLALNPLSVGVATLDAMDENGLIYSRATSTPFDADYLTSLPIDLRNVANDSSLWLSFYYQPQGIGDAPDRGDSLILDFYNPSLVDSIAWKTMWTVHGDSVYPFKQQMVMVPAEFLQKGFAFRFRNLASISGDPDAPGKHGNSDLWHLDYVRLDKGRNVNDTVLRDVACVKPMSSLLQTYQAMPWNHFILAFRNEIKPKIGLTYENNDSIGHLINRDFEVKDLYGSAISPISAGAENVKPFETFNSLVDLVNPFTTNATDSALFETKGFISYTDPISKKWPDNDTVRFKQVFNDYFALDDGSSESGYGLMGQGTLSARVAYKFNAYQPDTITAISIFFNPTEKNITTTTNYYFRLAVWADNKDQPGKIIYADSKSDYIPVHLNQFYSYKLDSGVLVNGKFYVGWIQINENYLNVGYDLNNNNQLRHFINISGTWANSAFKGSLMVRPVFRTKKSVVSNNPTVINTNLPLKIYPNPARDIVFIDKGSNFENETPIVSIFDLTGKQVLQISLHENSLDISNLPGGLYILRISGKKANSQPVKLLIQR
jgi:hypothetical protein